MKGESGDCLCSIKQDFIGCISGPVIIVVAAGKKGEDRHLFWVKRRRVTGQEGISLHRDVKACGDIAALEFASRREITIVIGTPPAAIPTYDWGTEQ